mmetsp:Transcript_17470/g.24281  ORF Transcript_17470/g.24281 Transcript_17470/m.24281 type:complete len:390 (+) Transcript_17470:92-1261(+)
MGTSRTSTTTLLSTLLLVGAAVTLPHFVSSFVYPGRAVVGSYSKHPFKNRVVHPHYAAAKAVPEDLDLKAELTRYLETRKENNADEESKNEVGKVLGGTKGNAVLEYISGAPNKPLVVEEQPNIFDYDQLEKYGFGYLVKPIMENGGRRQIYELMGLQTPAVTKRVKPKSAPKLVIDKKGETDKARYTGLKMGQVLDDDEMGRALERAKKKAQAGERMRPKLEEEDYVMPFADNPNKGPRQTPDWTPEMLDEEGRKRGQTIEWVRKAKAGEFVKDPYEAVAVEGALRIYSVMTTLLVAFAFGRATPTALSTLDLEGSSSIQEALQVPALAVLLAGIGSSVVAGVILAPPKNRSGTTWFIKGLFGGPLAVLELKGLGDLITRGEQEQIQS